MAETRLIHLDSSNLTAYRWWGGMVRPEAQFANDAGGYAAFTEYLQQRRSSLYYLLTDVPDESFQFETIPFVQGRDRDALLRRKLAQYFFGATLTASRSLGREKTGRRDERMLFMALTRAQFFEPWMAALHTAEAQLVGIYTIPLIAGSLLGRLGLTNRHPRMILVTIGRGGIRQTYFEGAQLRFSRLSAVPPGRLEDVARACGAECSKLYQYLVGQRVVARGSHIPAVVLVHPGQRAVFASVAAGGPLEYEFADLVAAATRSGMRGTPSDSSADYLFMHLMARHAPREQFAPKEARHQYRIWQARFGITATGALALFACLLFSGKQYYEIRQLQIQRAERVAETQQDLSRYNAILRDLPPMPTSLDNLRAVVDRFDRLVERSDAPINLFRRISLALEQSPAVEVERIEWRVTANPEEFGIQGAVGGTQPAANNPDMYAAALITASLTRNAAGDHRRVLAAIDQFAELLGQDKDSRVKVLELPFDVTPEKSLKSSDQAGGRVVGTRFAVRVSRPLGANSDPA